MRNKRIMVSVLILIALAGIGSAFLNVYYIRSDNGGTVMWNSSEAYLFLGGAKWGYHFTPLEYPWIFLKEYFNVPPFPNDRHISATVIHVTSSGIQRSTVDFGDAPGNSPNFLTPFGQNIFALCPGAILCKWNGTDFEPATAEENQRLDGTKGLVHGKIENLNGWSMREIGSQPGFQFTITVSKAFGFLVRNRTQDTQRYPEVSVELLRPGQLAQTLWSVDGNPRRVSKSEYGEVFKSH